MESEFRSFIERLEAKSQHLSKEMIYALYPAGKLFRPKLFLAILEDLKIEKDQSALNFALFLEVHHAYTLVHDDLPCMDDSPTRRGKDSVHKKFGEWRAVLTGDALLSLSYQLLSECKTARQQELQKLCFWSLGAKGLIGGQVLDLEAGDLDYKKIKRIHELKTGRLILLSTLAPYYFQETKDYEQYKKLWKLGSLIGEFFQLLDDYDDFIKHPDQSLNIFKVDESKARKNLEKSKASLDDLLSAFPRVQDLLKVLK